MSNSDRKQFEILKPELDKRLDRLNTKTEVYKIGTEELPSSYFQLANHYRDAIRKDTAQFAVLNIARLDAANTDAWINYFTTSKSVYETDLGFTLERVKSLREKLNAIDGSQLNATELQKKGEYLTKISEAERYVEEIGRELKRYDTSVEKLTANRERLIAQLEAQSVFEAHESKKVTRSKAVRIIVLGVVAVTFGFFLIGMFIPSLSQKTEVVTTAKAPAITTPPAPVVDTNRIQIAGGDIYYLDRNIKQVVDGEVLQMARREKDNQNRLLFKTRVGADYAYKDIGPVYDIVLLENKLGTALKAKPENFSVSVWIVLLNDAKSIHGTFFGNEIERAMRQVSNDPNNPKVREMYVWNGQVNGSNYLPKFLTWAKNEK